MKRTGVCLLLSAILLLMLLSGCGSEPSQGGMTAEEQDGVTVHNGTEQLFYQIENGHRGELHFRFKGESGSISLCVYMKGYPDYPYCKREIDSPTHFDVVLIDPGDYIVDIEARDYAGDYFVDWSLR